MKAFQEQGVDEIIGLVSCIEATLMLAGEKGNDKLKKRYKRLVDDDIAYKCLLLAYDIRRKYVHALGSKGDKTDWEEFAKCRWAVTKAVDNFLAISSREGGEGQGDTS